MRKVSLVSPEPVRFLHDTDSGHELSLDFCVNSLLSLAFYNFYSGKSYGPFDLVVFAQGRGDPLTLSLAGALMLLLNRYNEALREYKATIAAV